MNRLNINSIYRSTLFKNISSLYFIQGLNFIFPLLTLPYLTRTLGAEEYGKLILTQTIAIYGASIVGYGFALSATRKLALAQNSIAELSDTVSETLNAKLILTVITIVLFTVLRACDIFNYVEKYYMELLVLAIFSGWNFQWYFRGVEKMHFLVILDTVNKILFTLAIFIFVKQQSDGLMVLRIQSLILIIITGISFYIIKKQVLQIKFNFRNGIKALTEGKDTFIFSGLATFHSNAPLVFISYYATPQFIGIFAGAFKLSKQLMLMFANPLWDAIYPNLSHTLVLKTNIFSQRKVIAILIVNLTFGIIYGFLLFYFADSIVEIVLGKEFIETIPILKILVYACPLIIMNVSVLNILISKKYDRVVNISTSINILIVFCLLFFFTIEYGNAGSMWAIVISELLLLAELFFFYRKGSIK